MINDFYDKVTGYLYPFSTGLCLAMAMIIFGPQVSNAQIDLSGCYAVSDSAIDEAGGQPDELFSFNVPNVAGTSENLGDTGTNFVEAIEFVTARDKLYFGNGTEIWVSEGPDYDDPVYCGDVVNANNDTVTDIDGMTFNPNTNQFYISDRNGTGAPGGGGAGGAGAPDDQFWVLSISDDPACIVTVDIGPISIPTTAATETANQTGLADIDDLAYDQVSDELYGIINNSNNSDSFLAKINRVTAAVTDTVRLDLAYGPIDDVEGLTFTPGGSLLVTTGESAGSTINEEGPNSSEVWVINPTTGAGELLADINDSANGGNGSDRSDFESITCGQARPPGLDVSLIDFNLKINSVNATLTWKTASEENNAGFTIEMATENEGFLDQGFVTGNGTISTESTYSFAIQDLEPGKHQFRLRQVDFDGSTTYSEILTGSVDLPGDYLLGEAFPNPFNPSTSIQFMIKEQGPIRFALHDATGRELRSLYQGTPAAATFQTIQIDASDLPSGIYLVRMIGRNFSATQTITLLK